MTSTKVYDAFGLLVSSSGSSASPFGYVGAQGYQEDGDSGLQLLGHRYYDPSTGRFLTRDHVKDGRNWYGYCGNNPLGSADPTGFGPFSWLYETIDFIKGLGGHELTTGQKMAGGGAAGGLDGALEGHKPRALIHDIFEAIVDALTPMPIQLVQIIGKKWLKNQGDYLGKITTFVPGKEPPKSDGTLFDNARYKASSDQSLFIVYGSGNPNIVLKTFGN